MIGYELDRSENGQPVYQEQQRHETVQADEGGNHHLQGGRETVGEPLDARWNQMTVVQLNERIDQLGDKLQSVGVLPLEVVGQGQEGHIHPPAFSAAVTMLTTNVLHR